MLVPVAVTTADRARRPKERIKWKEIAGALRRKKKLKQASQESVDVSLTSMLMLNMLARTLLGVGVRGTGLTHRMSFGEERLICTHHRR